MMVPSDEQYLRPLPTPKKMLGHWALTAFLVVRPPLPLRECGERHPSRSVQFKKGGASTYSCEGECPAAGSAF